MLLELCCLLSLSPYHCPIFADQFGSDTDIPCPIATSWHGFIPNAPPPSNLLTHISSPGATSSYTFCHALVLSQCSLHAQHLIQKHVLVHVGDPYGLLLITVFVLSHMARHMLSRSKAPTGCHTLVPAIMNFCPVSLPSPVRPCRPKFWHT